MNNLQIGTKLMLAYILMAALTMTMGMYMGYNIDTLAHNDGLLYSLATEPMGELVIATKRAQEMRVQFRDWKNATSEEARQVALKKMDDAKADAMRLIARQQQTTADEGIRSKFKKWEATVDEYTAAVHFFIRNTKEFCPSSGMNTAAFPNDVLNSAGQMDKAQEAAIEAKIKGAENLANGNESRATTAAFTSKIIMAFAFISSFLIAMFLSKSIVPPLGLVSTDLAKLEAGDMTVRTNLVREDAIGKLSKAADNMAANLQKIFTNMRMDSDSIASASEELSSVSRDLASGAEETVNQCTTVSSTTGAMATNINSMASGAEQASASANEVANAADRMSENMSTIAAAIEQMSASIGEIANNTADVRRVATGASTKATEATSVMGTLGAAAKEIGQVTDVIKKIAAKTNLLALKATIEAASAGEAGKGFAVVAGEIKELANQSAKSADDIAQRIEGIQSGTSNAVNVINEVSGIIENINSSVKVIAAHVDEQTKASNEIANNVAQANASAKQVAKSISEVAKGANDVSHNAAEAARGASEVSNSTHEMIRVAAESAQGATHVHQSSGELARIAADLKNVINKFKT
jgi:methyl-accepting chemotaxis protein